MVVVCSVMGYDRRQLFISPLLESFIAELARGFVLDNRRHFAYHDLGMLQVFATNLDYSIY